MDPTIRFMLFQVPCVCLDGTRNPDNECSDRDHLDFTCIHLKIHFFNSYNHCIFERHRFHFRSCPGPLDPRRSLKSQRDLPRPSLDLVSYSGTRNAHLLGFAWLRHLLRRPLARPCSSHNIKRKTRTTKTNLPPSLYRFRGNAPQGVLQGFKGLL